jgi:hypothetical protein
MSELKVNKVTFGDLSSQQTAADRSFRNKVINGDMAINQEYGSGAVTPAASGYVSDQWRVGVNIASKLTFQQVTDAPDGFNFSTKITVAAQYSPAAANTFAIAHPIEGQNIIDINFGKASAKTISLSLWVKGSVPGKYSIALRNGDYTRAYIGTINVTSTWTKQFVTLQADTTGTWVTDNTQGLLLSLDLGSGSNFNTTAGTWTTGTPLRTSDSVTFVNQPNGSTLNITGVQFEIGAPSEFEMVPYDEQWRRCQRYLYRLASTTRGDVITGLAFNTGGCAFPVTFPVSLRTTPLLSSNDIFATNGGGVLQAGIGQNIYNFTSNSALVVIDVTAGVVTVGQASLLCLGNGSGGVIQFDARM